MTRLAIRFLERIDELVLGLLPHAEEVQVATAYLSAAMVERLLVQREQQAKPTSARTTVLFGADLSTDPEAVDRLLQAAQNQSDRFQVRFVPHRGNSLFHPKVYAFRCGGHAHLIVGSGNFTTAGQFRNTELYCHVECAVGSDLERQFQVIWDGWAAAPFSLPLSAEVADRLRTRAQHVKEFLHAEQRQEELRTLFTAEEQLWQTLTAGSGGRRGLAPEQGRDPKEQLRAKLAAGFLFQCHVSLAQLQVPVTEELLSGDERRGREEPGQAVLLDASVSAYVRLLPSAAWAEFEQLARQADRELRSLALPTSAGAFVPASAYASFRTCLAQLRRRHRQLVSQHLRDAAPVREHLQAHLREEIERAWATAYPEHQGPPPRTVTEAVRAKVEVQRRCLRARPAEAVPFTLTRWLHPEVTRVSYPAHPMWRLEAEDPDELLLATVLRLLERQTEAVAGVTRWQQQPARKKDYDRVSRLLFLSGKQTRRWFRLLLPGTKPPQPGTAEERRRRVQLIERHTQRVRTETEEHQQWLGGLRLLAPTDAFAQLSAHYELG